MNWLKSLFSRTSLLQTATKELAEAEYALLVAHTGIEWAQASASYNEARIARLRAFINGGTTP